jgi:hypothetical protein
VGPFAPKPSAVTGSLRRAESGTDNKVTSRGEARQRRGPETGPWPNGKNRGEHHCREVAGCTSTVHKGFFLDSGQSGLFPLRFVREGPGMPEYWPTKRYPAGMASPCIVACWERGSALSFGPQMRRRMTAEQLIDDTLVTTEQLCPPAP